MNRRRFLECTAAGAASALVSGHIGCLDRPERDITVDTIAAAEKIAGLELTPEERERICEGVNGNLEYYESLREHRLEYTVNPSMVFRPLVSGTPESAERRPFRASKVRIDRPRGDDDLAFLSVLELAELIRTRRLTSLELTELYLARMKRYDPVLQMVITLTEKSALIEARQADREIAGGKYRGLLHGIPYGIKDLFAATGYPTTWGAEPFRNRVFDHDASVVARLREAGAVLVAKLACGALASGEHWFGGITRNPWNPEWSPGGSSSGPAAATVAGCVAFAIGTETNGSMVSPCNECGVTGLRPTFGRVSRHGAMTVSWSMDKVTPICRTVEDCAVVFEAVRGPDGKDNSLIDLPFNWDPTLDIRTLRIGYHTRFFEKELMGNPTNRQEIEFREAIRAESRTVLAFLRRQGVDLKPLDFDIQSGGAGIILETEAAAAFDEFTRGNLDDLLRDSGWPDTFRRFRFVPAVEYLQAVRQRNIVMQRMDQALRDIDVYVEITWSNNWITNLTGHPIVVVPCGAIYGSKPVSITFVGKPFEEDRLLAVAKAYQDATDHHLRRPELT